MSSCEGVTLESWVRDSFRDGNDIKLMSVVSLLEDNRESIENMIGDYDEETQSWRDYRNSLWSYYENLDEPIARIMSQSSMVASAALYLFPAIGDMKLKALVESGNNSLEAQLTTWVKHNPAWSDFNKPNADVRTAVSSIFHTGLNDLGKEILRNM